VLNASSTACLPLPSAPANVTATPGNGQALVSFDAAGTNGGPAISSYTVTSNPGGYTYSGAGTTIKATGLINGTSYTFTVVATNSVGSSSASAPSNAVTPLGTITSGSFQKSFAYTGAAQTWVVPAGLTSVSVDLGGAQGGTGSFYSGGNGGRLQATLTVTPGGTVNIFVGGRGADISHCVPCSAGFGGWNGGGGDSSTNANWAGGGGATDVRVAGTALTNRVAVAGGGGGSANGGQPGGPGGGLIGGQGGYTNSGPGSGTAGTGGTQSAGGSPGCWWSGSGCGGAGSLGVGGSEGNSSGTYGGSGGGGYYGGGGSTNNAGGAGGSNFCDGVVCTSPTHTQGYQSGAGYAIITFPY
jgi:hypothetical protein